MVLWRVTTVNFTVRRKSTHAARSGLVPRCACFAAGGVLVVVPSVVNKAPLNIVHIHTLVLSCDVQLLPCHCTSMLHNSMFTALQPRQTCPTSSGERSVTCNIVPYSYCHASTAQGVGLDAIWQPRDMVSAEPEAHVSTVFIGIEVLQVKVMCMFDQGFNNALHIISCTGCTLLGRWCGPAAACIVMMYQHAELVSPVRVLLYCLCTACVLLVYCSCAYHALLLTAEACLCCWFTPHFRSKAAAAPPTALQQHGSSASSCNISTHAQ